MKPIDLGKGFYAYVEQDCSVSISEINEYGEHDVCNVTSEQLSLLYHLVKGVERIRPQSA